MSAFIKAVLNNIKLYSGVDGRYEAKFTICTKDEESLVILTSAGVVGVFGKDAVNGNGGSLHLSEENMGELAEAWVRRKRAN